MRAGQKIGTRDRCPRKCVRPEHLDLIQAWREHRAGRALYPTLLHYPLRMLRLFELLDEEQRTATKVPRG